MSFFLKILNVIKEPYRLTTKIRLLLEFMLSIIPFFSFFKITRHYENPIKLNIWFKQKVMGYNGSAYWPMHSSSLVSYPKNILIGKGVDPGYSPGCYLHAVNKIYIGDYTFIAPNVGIMSGNHDFKDLRIQTKNNPVRIGKYCWIGMNVVILPEVILGDFTVVGAGSIVTKSFEEGYCVIGGNPAKIIKKLNSDECMKYEIDLKFIGYIKVEQFEEFRKRNLNI